MVIVIILVKINVYGWTSKFFPILTKGEKFGDFLFTPLCYETQSSR